MCSGAKSRKSCEMLEEVKFDFFNCEQFVKERKFGGGGGPRGWQKIKKGWREEEEELTTLVDALEEDSFTEDG